jgi:DDE superfamily endonuclease
VLHGVDRATITSAVHEIRPLLARRAFAVPGRPGVRLRTLADVVAYAAAEGVELRHDGTETQVRRPRANRFGRRAFVSGNKQQNTIKVTTVCDRRGRTLWAGAVRPGRMHDQTAIKTEGIEELPRRYDAVHAKVDAGYRVWPRRFLVGSTRRRPSQPRTRHPRSFKPGSRPASSSPPSGSASSTPTPSINKQWRALQRWIGRREHYTETHLAIAGLVSDRAARR